MYQLCIKFSIKALDFCIEMKPALYNFILVVFFILLLLAELFFYGKNEVKQLFILSLSMTVTFAGLLSAFIQKRAFKKAYLHNLLLLLMIGLLLFFRAIPL